MSGFTSVPPTTASLIRLYIDGLVRAAGSSRVEFDGLNGPLVIGVLCSEAHHYLSHAAMADIGIWKSALSVHQMYAVRSGQTARTARSSMLCHMEFREPLRRGHFLGSYHQ